MTDNRTTELKSCMKCIDDMTDDLLEISDVLEEYQVNVRLENGRYLNPVSAIRSKVDVIWDEVQFIAAMLRSGTCEIESSFLNDFTSEHECWYEFEMKCGYRFTWGEMEPPRCCPNCGGAVKVVDA